MYLTSERRSASRSTLQAFITCAASESSSRARRRCSSVAYSWCRSLASLMARWSTCSRLRDRDGIYALLLFHCALQRMLMPPREFNHLRHLCFRDFIGEDAADAYAVAMHVQHDLHRFLPGLVEELLENMNHKLHRRIVVVQQQHLIEARPLGLR